MSDSGGGSPRDDDDAGADDAPPDDPASDPSAPPSEEPPRDDPRSSGAGRSVPNAGSGGPPADGPPGSPPSSDPPPVAGRASGSPARRNVPDPRKRPLLWYLRTERPLVVASRDIVSSVLLVAVVGLALFAVSGVWPPLVAVESGSMEPNMQQGDLVLVVEDDRFSSQLADEHGVVTREAALDTDHRQFGKPGSVIVFKPDGQDGTPIIHRAVMHVEENENWVAQADPAHLGNVDECSDTNQCPARYEGYITRGDANQNYDQIDGQSTVVKPEWIRGRAVSRTPYLGCIRLALSDGGYCGD